MKATYVKPQTKIVGSFVSNPLTSSGQGGVIATAPDMEGEMNCDCGGDPSQCTCGDCCDCWGCGGFESKQRNGFYN